MLMLYCKYITDFNSDSPPETLKFPQRGFLLVENQLFFSRLDFTFRHALKPKTFTMQYEKYATENNRCGR